MTKTAQKLKEELNKEIETKEKDDQNIIIKDRNYYHHYRHQGNLWNNPSRFKGKSLEFHYDKIIKDQEAEMRATQCDIKRKKLRHLKKKETILKRKKEAKEKIEKRKLERLCLQKASTQYINYKEKKEKEFKIANEIEGNKLQTLSRKRSGGNKMFFTGVQNKWNDYEKLPKNKLDLVFTPQVLEGERKAIEMINARIENDMLKENIIEKRKKVIHDNILSKSKSITNNNKKINCSLKTSIIGNFDSRPMTGQLITKNKRNIQSGIIKNKEKDSNGMRRVTSAAPTRPKTAKVNFSLENHNKDIIENKKSPAIPESIVLNLNRPKIVTTMGKIESDTSRTKAKRFTKNIEDNSEVIANRVEKKFEFKDCIIRNVTSANSHKKIVKDLCQNDIIAKNKMKSNLYNRPKSSHQRTTKKFKKAPYERDFISKEEARRMKMIIPEDKVLTRNVDEILERDVNDFLTY